MKTILISLCFLTVLITPRVSLACVCGGSPSPCSSFAAAEAVFVGTVSRVEGKTAKSPGGADVVVGQIAYVQVEESFKGVKASEMIFRSYGTSCDAFYTEGERRLFYAYFVKEDNAWVIRPCDRSALIDRAGDDLLYLRNLPVSSQTTRIAGVIRTKKQQPMMGIKVKVTDGTKVYETFTDKNGVYEMLGLPPGKYSIEPEVPLTLKIRNSFPTGEYDMTIDAGPRLFLKEKSCAGMNFWFTENTSLSGKVFGADGRPLKDACVSLVPKDPEPDLNALLFKCTKADGGFNLEEIPLGNYILVLNEDGRVTSTEPFPTVYYPGVFDKEKATVLTLASGDQRQDVDIHVPSEQPTQNIEGRLLFSDGPPAADVSVEFSEDARPDKESEKVSVRTDSNGRFSLTVLAGLKGSLRGIIVSYSGEYRDCARMEKFLKGQEYRTVELQTNVIKLETKTDYKDLELKFPFPYCAKTNPPRR